MTDLEMTKLCAEAMGLTVKMHPIRGTIMRYWSMDGNVEREYNPLHNDAQAMALVKFLHLHIGKTLRTPEDQYGTWFVSRTDRYQAINANLNRAIVECVAKLQESK